MYKYICDCTGIPDSVEYHRDFAEVGKWAEELQTSVQNRPDSAVYERHLVNHGLSIILRMINECAYNPAVDLEEVCRVMDPISPGQCRSCRHKVWKISPCYEPTAND